MSLSPTQRLVKKVVLPAVAAAEREFGVALSRINVEDLVRDAQALGEAGPGGTHRGGAALKIYSAAFKCCVHDLDFFGAIPLRCNSP